MSTTLVENAIFLILGWMLSTATFAGQWWFARRREKTTHLTHVRGVLESILIDIELTRTWRELGLIETVEGLLEVDESWRKRIPPVPPSLPSNWDTLLERVADWEARRGKFDLTRDLRAIAAKLAFLGALHAGMTVIAKQDDLGPVPERSLGAFASQSEELKESVKSLLRRVRSM